MTRYVLGILCAALFVAAVLCVGIETVTNSGSWLLMATGLLAPVALGVPLVALRRNIHPLDPACLLFLYVIIGSTMAAAYLAFGTGYRRDYLMSGEDVWFFARGGLWVVGGLIAFAFANALTSSRVRLEAFPILSAMSLPRRRLAFLGVVATLLSIAATVEFLRQTGSTNIFSLGEISRKRALIIELSGGETIRGSAAYLRALAGITLPAALVTIAIILREGRRLTAIANVGVGLLVLSSLALPFFASSRSDVLISLAQLAMIFVLFGRIKTSTAVTVVVAMLAIFGAMTGLRLAAQGGDLAQRSAEQNNPLVNLASSGNGLSIIGTSIVVNRVPERMDYMMGSSLFTWITAPIPRSVWPTKPEVSLGKVVKDKLLGQRVIASGRPPGILGEGYMNFGPIGLILAGLAFGYFSRLFWNSFAPIIGQGIGGSVLFVSLWPHIAVLANANVSQVVVRLLTTAIITIAVLAFLNAGVRRNRQPSAARLGLRSPAG